MNFTVAAHPKARRRVTGHLNFINVFPSAFVDSGMSLVLGHPKFRPSMSRKGFLSNIRNIGETLDLNSASRVSLVGGGGNGTGIRPLIGRDQVTM